MGSAVTNQQPRWTQAGGHGPVVLTGDWLADIGPMPPAPPVGTDGPVQFDVSGLGRWDSGLIAFLWDTKKAASLAGSSLDPADLPTSATKLLALLPDHAPPAVEVKQRRRFLVWVGDWTTGWLSAFGQGSLLLGGTVRGGVRALRHRAQMRWVDLAFNLRDAGPSALAIVAVVNFLVGAILAFVGAVQLRKFAADMYVANLVGLALVREMSAVMTAIVMAGRTGGAYAARIATMQGSEEIDALTVTGISVPDYVVLPAVLALVFTMPFLYLYGCLAGMLGGFVVAIGMLDVTGAGYLNQTLGAVGFGQFAFGFSKSIAFAVLIGVTSCQIGLNAHRSAAGVGVAATRAVVAGIVGVIAMDAAFAVMANVAGL